MPIPEPKLRVPRFSLHPSHAKSAAILEHINNKAVPATSANGGYPDIGSQATGPQEKQAILNTIKLQTVILGKVEGANLAQATFGQKDPSWTFTNASETYASHFAGLGSITSRNTKYHILVEEWMLHDAKVGMHNYGADVSKARARGHIAEANEKLQYLQSFQANVRHEIDTRIRALEQGIPDLSTNSAFNSRDGQVVEAEIERLRGIRQKSFESLPETVLPNPTMADAGSLAKKLYYLAKPLDQRERLWKDARFWKFMLPIMLEFVQGAMEIGSTLVMEKYKNYGVAHLARFCDGAIRMVISQEVGNSFFVIENANVFDRSAAKDLVQPDVS